MNKQIQRQWRGACEAGALPVRRSTGRSAPASPATPCQQPGARGRGAELARGGSWSPRSGRAGPPGRRGSSKRLCGGRTASGRAVGRERVAQPRVCGPVALRVAYRAVRGRYVAQRVRIHAIICTHRAEPTRVHDRSTSRRRERRCVEVPRPAAAACRNGALGGAAVAAERAGSARKFDGVPAVGPDEGPGSKTRAEAAVWGHGEPRRERSAPYLTRSVGWTTQLTDPTRADNPTQPKKHDSQVGPSGCRV